VRKTRFAFWRYLWWMVRHNRGGIGSYLGLCAYIEHFLPYRELIKAQINAQLAVYQERERVLAAEAAETPDAVPRLATGTA
jgi:hypothetical protein